MSKRILLISHCFAPQNKIGAVRPTKLAKYLLRMGYQVTVLCGKDYTAVQDPLLARDLEQMQDVHRVVEKSLLRRWKEKKQPSAVTAGKPAQGKEKPVKRKALLNTLYLLLANRADSAFARACIKEVKRMGEQYDIVLSSYGPLSVHKIACKVKRLGYAEKWIADFRDETNMPFAFQGPRVKRYNRMVTRYADRITCVSAGYLRVMGMEDTGRVLYNGFDREDLQGISFPAKRKDKLSFVHFGQMYGMQRDLSPFFTALSELITEGAIEKADVALVYAGRDTRGFVMQATNAGLAECLEGHPFMPRDESIRLQKAAHVLLLPAWNLQDRQGNIPGKLLEYMMLEMPVVCCVSGNVPDSEIAGIIRKTNIGVCYEQANHMEDAKRLKAYLREVIKAYRGNMPLPFTPNRAAVDGFTSKGMAGAMANIIEEWT